MTTDPAANSTAVVQITLGQVYSEVTGMRADVRDLASTMKTAVSQLGDHESRLRTVEHDYVTAADLEKVARSAAEELGKATAAAAADLEKVRQAGAEALAAASKANTDASAAAVGRISSLERFRWTVTPLATALSAAGAAALTKVVSGH